MFFETSVKTNDNGFNGGNSYINTDNQIELIDFKGKKCSDTSDCDIDLICNKQKVCVKDLDKNIQDDVVIYNGEIYYTDYRNDFIEYDTNCPANKKFRVNDKCYNYDDASNYKCTTDCKKCSIKNQKPKTCLLLGGICQPTPLNCFKFNITHASPLPSSLAI